MKGTYKQELEPQNCHYCDALFQPKRRWIQKFCCESCRTMACRQRNNGIGGTRETKRRSTSITDLNNALVSYQNQSLEQLLKLNNDLFELKLNFSSFTRQSESDNRSVKDHIMTSQDSLLNNMRTSFNQIDLGLKQQAIKMQLLNKNQNTQQWITILAGLFGTQLGDLVWKKGKKAILGNKGENDEDKLERIMGIIKELI